jgi:protoheme IX farnesyltransferase
LQKLTFSSLLQLTRYKVSLAVTFSGLAASVVFMHGLFSSQLIPMIAIFLLASGSSALNQWQESKHDALMVRTSFRPLPSGAISPATALAISFLLVAGGMVLLLIGKMWVTAALGIFNVLWYNGLYTPMKRKTAFAVVPGALTGAMPVFMGWTSAGGHMTDAFPLLLGFFIFMWQVPHFWLLGMMYDNDYKSAGFPVITALFHDGQINRIIFSWLLASSASSILILVFGQISSDWIKYFIILLNIILIGISFHGLFLRKPAGYRFLFILVNIFMLLVFLLVIIEHIIAGN